MHTHYDNLKVTRGAPAEVIRAAYKALSQRYHPDKNDSPDAQRIMRIINEAYTVLGDADRRAAYDRELAAREQDDPKVQGPAPNAFATDNGSASAASWPFDMGRQEPGFNGNGRTAYDAAAAYHAASNPGGLSRKTMFAAALVALLCAFWIWHASHRQAAPQLASDVAQSTGASFAWTNPVSHASVNIDSIWTLAVTQSDKGQPIYTFTEGSGRAAIVFAREDLPDVGFDKYIPAYLHNNAATMPLGAPGNRETIDGHESWSADGHLIAFPATRTHVELRHIGSSFWRLVTVQAQPYEDSDDAARTLKARLWSTLAGL
ncbi:J domain-containing protein [Paraburkholderia phenazinium]|uniref:DnaJ domain-containing protein n=1 Tax=Paraburkholderia phenazinium TaxID=60549 RepID=A0A1G8JDE3_9BURK|nr:J domain-containing protein [Paraburkholderia phenazinium]SDI29279.1 DnaJ domain-containing protein [Paraburkholderia phenazinium]